VDTELRAGFSAYQAKYFAHELARSYANDHVGKLAGLLFDAQVEPKPHQIDAALFALNTPHLPGVLLADEVGLGKTIEAGIVITQFWSERRRRILIVAPASLRQQWKQELFEKFFIDATILDSSKGHVESGGDSSGTGSVSICSYEYLIRRERSLLRQWDLIVADEAHRLRNHWSGKNKAGSAMARLVANSHKAVFLTATPLQNKLEELYGIVSVFHPGYFYSLESFRERYVKGRAFSGDDLAERVAIVSKRTLRKDADKYIRFTERLPLTVEFTPSKSEVKLYNLVNGYLQREDLMAFTGSQRHLIALILRKRLGSSTFAIASTLENIANRLEQELETGVHQSDSEDFFVEEELTSDEREEFQEVDSLDEAAEDSPTSREEMVRIEAGELRSFAALARSITVNEKAKKLNEALDKGFTKLREIGAPEKAIIFTDSTKTQEYLAQSLRESGKGEGLVLFNGSNTSPESQKIYRNWMEANAGGDLITGIPASDRRKALVDYFRDSGQIMIATEAAGEGVNLQFCSMVVNYDLPWNPQRVEQRIGRCHRYGQQHNVVVVNFANQGNAAEARILELLATKFRLFESVFGASDQVLGSIEDGFDFEKKISAILDRCKTADEINTAFDELEAEFAVEISEEMDRARAKVFDNLDPTVQDRLRTYDEESGVVLNTFERLLLAVTKFELEPYADFHGDGRLFDLHNAPAKGIEVGRYFFKSQPEKNAHQYRFASPLAELVVDQAVTRDTPPAKLTFSLSQSKRVSASIKQLAGKSGVLVTSLVEFTMSARDRDLSESYLVSAGRTEDGQKLDSEYVAELLELACVQIVHPANVSTKGLESSIASEIDTLGKEVQSRNSRFHSQQEDIIYRSIEDRKAEADARIREFRAKEKEERRLAKLVDDPVEQLNHKKAAKKWDQRAEEEDESFRAEKKALKEEGSRLLELIEQSLRGTKSERQLFAAEWEVVE
jgi:ERCC4-related helicase